MKKKNYLLKIVLLLAAICLFVLSNPNFFVKNGIGFLAFFIYVPVLLLVNLCSIKECIFYGGLYGSISYGLYCYWLYNFDPVCIYAVCIVYFLVFSAIFVLLKLIEKLDKKNGWVLMWLALCSFEYVKTLGFLGFSYGVTAYTQWKNVYLIQICKYIGVFGLNAIVIFSSAVIYSFIQKIKDKKIYINEKYVHEINKKINSNIGAHVENEKNLSKWSLKSTTFGFICFIIVILSCLTYGFFTIKQENPYELIKVIAIQSNESPWKNGIEEYTKDINVLMKLTDESLELNPDAQLIVWPETAVVPAIVYQFEVQKDERRLKLVTQLLQYMNNKETSFVIGNGHEVNSLKPKHDVYNSALFFTSGENVLPPNPKIYSKIKLVPFTETFPYQKSFPNFYRKLTQKNKHMWTAGSEIKVFKQGDLFFSTPICFEDTFGQICRKMAKEGSRCFVNLSNDSWSKSIVCQNQHLAMAVFRSVENGVPTVRSTTSGQTCIISQNGEITAMCGPFSKSYVAGTIPVIPQYENTTIYTKFGDILGIIPLIVFLILLIIRTIFVIIETSSK